MVGFETVREHEGEGGF